MGSNIEEADCHSYIWNEAVTCMLVDVVVELEQMELILLKHSDSAYIDGNTSESSNIGLKNR